MTPSTRKAPSGPVVRESAHRHRSVAALQKCYPCQVRLHRFVDATPQLAVLLALYDVVVADHYARGNFHQEWSATCDVCVALIDSASILKAAGIQPRRIPT